MQIFKIHTGFKTCIGYYILTFIMKTMPFKKSKKHASEGFNSIFWDSPQLAKGNVFLVVQLICHSLQPVALDLLTSDDRPQWTLTLEGIKKSCIPEAYGAPDGLLA